MCAGGRVSGGGQRQRDKQGLRCGGAGRGIPLLCFVPWCPHQLGSWGTWGSILVRGVLAEGPSSSRPAGGVKGGRKGLREKGGRILF